MSKRKYSTGDPSNMFNEHEDPRAGPVTVVIDREGDLYMKLDTGSLKVSRKTLSLSSPVFLAMFGAGSKFKEVTDKTVDHEGVQIVTFDEDNFEMMAVIANIMHLRSDLVPSTLTFKQLYQIAVLCDKYDLKRCLGPWTSIWATPYLDCYARLGYEEWLFMSVVFQYDGVFKEVTRHAIINAELSEQGTLVTSAGFDLSEGVPSTILDRITKSRAETMFVIQDLYWQELSKLRSSKTARVCKVGGVNVEKCDAINLGCLYQQFPDLRDPRRTRGACGKTVKSMVDAATGILELSGALVFKFGDHRPCAVGSRLASEAKKLLDAVEGLDLNDIAC